MMAISIYLIEGGEVGVILQSIYSVEDPGFSTRGGVNSENSEN